MLCEFHYNIQGEKKQKWIELKGTIKNYGIRNINKYAISIMHENLDEKVIKDRECGNKLQ